MVCEGGASVKGVSGMVKSCLLVFRGWEEPRSQRRDLGHPDALLDGVCEGF